ncbi:HAD-IIB family hydrolase [Variovorax arabinosiphilus]|uniref:HAD-IIB family hydrolase n=1 Tax=Variovorax arabinosiphilus TaxID=3053498 RepID=UPI0025780F38|nr:MULTISPECIES: HAD-IIB family hydrolase [unclassified Variovorax]MDM0119052.1 HAD-IIB family hydrolase [Variovorax sp. J2L1-78]MDM0129478.1 HAD-IIB family hydrolase [Variovorax sp. J2L1-63]MDM0232736.1 HAD-IIB family hydrolase [Variovorax sp. J2R1-6]
MQALSAARPETFRSVRFVLTDMDETLTHQGRLSAAAYAALERLQASGITVIPVTAAPAGWCDQMARMWPVDGVIGENGGLFFRRTPDGHGVMRTFWHEPEQMTAIRSRLEAISLGVRERVHEAVHADDQPFRQTSLAFAHPQRKVTAQRMVDALRAEGADATINNLWVLGWLGGYDKLAMTRRVMAEIYGVDIDAQRDAVLYAGDSTNDAPMFGFFRHTVGMSTVREYLSEIPTWPNWIAAGPGGAGFVQTAEAVLAGR